MSVTIEELQELIDKDAIVHIIQPDGSVKETEGVIKAATVAGVPFKTKGKAGVDLLMVDQIEEVSLAPSKPKSISQKKIKPIATGAMRQHLADRHGISLKWCRDASEAEAVTFHDTLDHKDLGHIHVEPKTDEAKDERTEALAE